MRTLLIARVAGLACATIVASCGDAKPPGDAKAPAWYGVIDGVQPALLSVWGASPSDVFAVGGPRGNGTPASVLHYDGHHWKELAPGGMDTFWWAHGTSGQDIWMVGENGRITHYDGAAFVEHASGTTATIYGVWAASATDVWAVGGTPEGGTSKPNDVLLHFDGRAWTPSPLPATYGRAFFKVWGTASDNLYVVGEAGTIWHRRGAAWALEAISPLSSSPIATGNLTTVAGCGPNEVYAVGGRDVLRSDGSAWTRDAVSASLSNDVNGVACASAGNAVLVGFGGLKMRWVAGQWHDDAGNPPYADLHGAWADGTGAYWTAGGDFLSYPRPGVTRAGVVGYYGTVVPSGVIAR